MNGTPVIPIAPEDRGMAMLTHLSGLAGYIIPFCGVIVPLTIWMVKRDVPLISAIARQAVLLNVVAFIAAIGAWILVLTLVLIPVSILIWCAAFIGAVALPIMGAMKASDGIYYNYPVVGANP